MHRQLIGYAAHPVDAVKDIIWYALSGILTGRETGWAGASGSGALLADEVAFTGHFTISIIGIAAAEEGAVLSLL